MAANSTDVIKGLGNLVLGTRLKRLSDRLMRDVSLMYRDHNLYFEARWFTTVYALSRHPRRSITELAADIGLTHAAINQIARELTREGLVTSDNDRTDRRKRMLKLTAQGRKINEALKPGLKIVRKAVDELLQESETEWMNSLGNLERALDRESLYMRLQKRSRITDRAKVTIESYRPAYKKHFASLNYEWIEQFFKIEEPDRKVLSDPNRQIIKRGGEILFAKYNGEIVGTCALINQGNDSWELAKMAVRSTHQGLGIGRILGEAIVKAAKNRKAKHLFLETNPKLTAATTLYYKLGFKKVDQEEVEKSKYERAILYMEILL